MKRISLNGQWEFVADLDPKYHNDTGIHGVITNSRPDINRRHWRKVQVPGVWQKYAERYDIYEGTCWFVKEFILDAFEEGTPARLRFGAVNYLCRVFVNGSEAGGHETGYTEFVLDVAKQLKKGTNHISVMVDNRSQTIKWPPCLGYFNYGGIHRDVTLEILDRACMDDLKVSGGYNGAGGSLKVSGTVTGAKAGVACDGFRVTVSCNGCRTDSIPDASGYFTAELDVPAIKPWSPESPALYDVSLALSHAACVYDQASFATGFRTVGMKNSRIFLNGEDYKLKGVCYVYDSPDSGLVMKEEQMHKDLALMKEMGCNTVRCHYPMDGKFYEACDRLGLMVWIEPTVYCYHPENGACDTSFSDPEWKNLAEQMIKEMILVAYNHTSVVIYGIGNECNTANPEAEEFFRSLSRCVKGSDATRLVSYAALYGLVGPLAEMVDVLGVNSYWGWYDKIYGGKGLKPEDDSMQKEPECFVEPVELAPMRAMLEKVISEGPKKLALLLTEFGADSVPGYFSRSRDLWSEDYHAGLLEEIFKLSEEYPQIVGTFPFCFTDYRDPSKPVNGYWNELNLKGMVTYERRKKMPFETVKEYYGK